MLGSVPWCPAAALVLGEPYLAFSGLKVPPNEQDAAVDHDDATSAGGGGADYGVVEQWAECVCHSE